MLRVALFLTLCLLALAKIPKSDKIGVPECSSPECIAQRSIQAEQEYAKLVDKLSIVDLQLQSVAPCVPVAPATECSSASSPTAAKHAKLTAKRTRLAAELAALDATGIDGLAIKARVAAEQAANGRRVEELRLEEFYKEQQAAKKTGSAESAPVPADASQAPKYVTLIEQTQRKIQLAKQKVAELEEKLVWLQSNPQIPQAAAAVEKNAEHVKAAEIVETVGKVETASQNGVKEDL